jgi:hypothetical protein
MEGIPALSFSQNTRLLPVSVSSRICWIRSNSDTVQLLARIFDRVLDRYSTDVPVAKEKADLHSELGGYIIVAAQTGESDEDRLAQQAYMKLRSGRH